MPAPTLQSSPCCPCVVPGAGSYQSLSWGAASIGGITSAYFSGSLIEEYGVSFVFGLTAFFPLLTLGSALLISEKRVPPAPPGKPGDGTFTAQIEQVWRPHLRCTPHLLHFTASVHYTTLPTLATACL